MVAVGCADPTEGGSLLPQQSAVCCVAGIHLPRLQESLHRLAGMDAISHIMQMWEAKHYRKLHDVWHTQHESISVGNFALAFTTTLLAPTLAREFQADDSFGLFTEAWLVALKPGPARAGEPTTGASGLETWQATKPCGARGICQTQPTTRFHS